MEKVAVYGTLKKGGFWNKMMQKAEVKFVSSEYAEISSIKNIISSCGDDKGRSYPHVIFQEGTQKFLLVEIYEISLENIVAYIDPIEECTGADNDPYKRHKIITQLGENVWIYDSNWGEGDDIGDFFTHQEGAKKYYNWIDKKIGK